ncbi:MAG TPA: SpoIIE family protein phosphatase [Bacillus bacterium]|nr:SpoIIE family protein phosphatase [Bacillus sp. (in: firmicutes)]
MPSLYNNRKKRHKDDNPVFDSQLFKLIIFASSVIVFSIILMSFLVYFITEKEAVYKLKTKDLEFIAESISSKIDERIERAKETASVLAHDPMIIQWVKGYEKDEQLEKAVFEKIHHLAFDYDYSNSFVVSNLTGNYWDENGNKIDTMSENDPDDSWFYETISMGKPESVSVDYNEERKNTFAFINALIGDVQNPIGVTGVGLSLISISEEFQNFKYGDEGNLWLIDDQGTIYLSDDILHNGKNIEPYISKATTEKILQQFNYGIQILEYTNKNKGRIDLICFPLQSTNLKLLVEIPRFETVSFLNRIKWNTIIASSLIIIAIILLFYFISVKLANPYKRALEMNEQLELKVKERTKELSEKNRAIIDSIDYAKRIQESILPLDRQLHDLWNDYFLLWKPRDIVGGDFYWSKSFSKEQYLIAVGDCTGHGVPGALMSMLAISILNQIVDDATKDNPGLILQKLNQVIKETLNQQSNNGATDDGLDLGLCYIERGQKAIFSGAKCSLYIAKNGEVSIINGEKKSIGYRKTVNHYVYSNQVIPLQEGQCFYMSTDGFFDQNGGPKNYSFGKKRFLELIHMYHPSPLNEQKCMFEQELTLYMGDEAQRDDITVIAFRP